MSVKSISKRVGTGVLNATARATIALWNEHREVRIAEIDEEIEKLQEERDQLVSELIKADS